MKKYALQYSFLNAFFKPIQIQLSNINISSDSLYFLPFLKNASKMEFFKFHLHILIQPDLNLPPLFNICNPLPPPPLHECLVARLTRVWLCFDIFEIVLFLSRTRALARLFCLYFSYFSNRSIPSRSILFLV